MCLLGQTLSQAAEQPPPASFYWLALAWLGCLGGCVGSFMNVVIYRLPAGRSIVHPGSHCPRCAAPIRPWDNVPVVSWLILGGRCRRCHEPIAVRYLLVEGGVAALFVLLGAVEFFGAGSPQVPAWLTILWRVLLVCTLICIALIESDGQRMPLGVAVPALVVGLTLPLVRPGLYPVAALATLADTAPSAPMAALTGGCGLWAGGLLGFCVAAVCRRSQQPGSCDDGVRHTSPKRERGQPRSNPRLRFGLVWAGETSWAAAASVAAGALGGLYLGWQAALVSAVLATAALLATTVFRCCTAISWSAWFAAGLVGHLVLWQWLAREAPWLGPEAGVATIVAAAALMLAFCGSQRMVFTHRSDGNPRKTR